MAGILSNRRGRAELVMLAPFRDDGHAPLLARLSSGDAQEVQTYLRSLSAEKALALALAPGGGVCWWQDARTIADARSRVLARCKEKAGADCTPAAENFRLLGQTFP